MVVNVVQFSAVVPMEVDIVLQAHLVKHVVMVEHATVVPSVTPQMFKTVQI